MKNPHEFDLKKVKKFSIFTFNVHFLELIKMCGKTFSGIFFSLIINSYISMCTSYWTQDLKLETLSNETNEIDYFQHLNENKSINTFENENLFWTVNELNNTAETDLELQMDTPEVEVENEDKFDILEDKLNSTASTNVHPSGSAEINQTNESNSHIVLSDKTDAPDFTMHEKIVLQRNNCHLEIAIQENRDLKIEIRFQKLENTTSGQCCITLNGQERNMLGVLISNVHLNGNGSEEVLKVITADYGLNFVLKEYRSRNKYEPLLLTETHKVYIVLYYKVTDVSYCKQDTYFNLEVYNYKKYENYIDSESNQTQSYSSYNQG